MKNSNSKDKQSSSNKGNNNNKSINNIEGDNMEKNMRLFLKKLEQIESDEVNYSEYKIKEIISLTIGKSLLLMS